MLFFGLAHLRDTNLREFLVSYLILNLSLEILIYFYPVIRGLIFGLLVLSSLLIDSIAIKQKLMCNQKNISSGVLEYSRWHISSGFWMIYGWYVSQHQFFRGIPSGIY